MKNLYLTNFLTFSIYYKNNMNNRNVVDINKPTIYEMLTKSQ